MSNPALQKAHIAILREEIQHVQWLAQHSKESAHRAAAALRVVALEKELQSAQDSPPPPKATRRKHQAA